MGRRLTSIRKLRLATRNISLLRSVHAMVRARSARVIVYRKTRIRVARGGRLTVSQLMHIGRQWSMAPPYRGHLVIEQRGCLSAVGRMSIYSGAQIWVHEGASLTIGSGFINNGVVITCSKEITIGNGCAIGEDVHIRDDHGHSITGGQHVQAGICIGDDVWIGEGALVLPGVSIGHGSVIGARAVVTRDVPSKCLAVGVPAKVVRHNIGWSS